MKMISISLPVKILGVLILILTLLSCTEEEYSDGHPRQELTFSLSVDGKSYDYLPDVSDNIMDERGNFYLFAYSGESVEDENNIHLQFYTENGGAFVANHNYTLEKGIWYITYSVSLPEENSENYYDSRNNNIRNATIRFEKAEKTNLVGEIVLKVERNGEIEEHRMNFDLFVEENDYYNLIEDDAFDPTEGDGGTGSGGNGSNGGSSGNCGMENYNGPEFDVQVDSQCKMAYAYDCAGEIQARNAACDVYYEYGNAVWTGSGSLPNCPYCP